MGGIYFKNTIWGIRKQWIFIFVLNVSQFKRYIVGGMVKEIQILLTVYDILAIVTISLQMTKSCLLNKKEVNKII